MERNRVFEEMLDHGPSPGSLVFVLSRMKEEGRINDVVRTCIRFLEVYPDDMGLRTLLAESYRDMGFIALAESEFQKVCLRIDHMASAFRSLADIYEKRQRHAEAADMLRRYLAHDPEAPEALESLRRVETALASKAVLLEAKGSVEEPGPGDDEAVEDLVDFATPTIAELYYSQGRIDAAIQTYERVVSSHPEDGESFARLEKLRNMLNPPAKIEQEPPSAARGKEERMVSILERWLPRIRELRYG